MLQYISFVCLAGIIKPYIFLGLYFESYDIFEKAIVCRLQKRIIYFFFLGETRKKEKENVYTKDNTRVDPRTERGYYTIHNSGLSV